MTDLWKLLFAGSVLVHLELWDDVAVDPLIPVYKRYLKLHSLSHCSAHLLQSKKLLEQTGGLCAIDTWLVLFFITPIFMVYLVNSFRHPPTNMEEKLQLNEVHLLFLWPTTSQFYLTWSCWSTLLCVFV